METLRNRVEAEYELEKENLMSIREMKGSVWYAVQKITYIMIMIFLMQKEVAL